MPKWVRVSVQGMPNGGSPFSLERTKKLFVSFRSKLWMKQRKKEKQISHDGVCVLYSIPNHSRPNCFFFLFRLLFFFLFGLQPAFIE